MSRLFFLQRFFLPSTVINNHIAFVQMFKQCCQRLFHFRKTGMLASMKLSFVAVIRYSTKNEEFLSLKRRFC
ncbi:hypothetical protein BRO54_0729 [Geobacillus proteiniphilus]|uniref:Uncharacterized protein n=1 Tax=Geobacillus proteiniphilus TaxID=860353 RepID=A0A1Q5T680_9BACL|nr:hypothetical protein BRO54_0729 [Geobacillus proteiniphilus]